RRGRARPREARARAVRGARGAEEALRIEPYARGGCSGPRGVRPRPRRMAARRARDLRSRGVRVALRRRRQEADGGGARRHHRRLRAWRREPARGDRGAGRTGRHDGGRAGFGARAGEQGSRDACRPFLGGPAPARTSRRDVAASRAGAPVGLEIRRFGSILSSVLLEGYPPMTPRASFLVTLSTLLVAACGPSSQPSDTASARSAAAEEPGPAEAQGIARTAAAAVDAARLAGADAEPGQWMSTGRTYGEQRYSPLAEIT